MKFWNAETVAEPEAGNARVGYLQSRSTDLENVPDAHFGLGHAVDSQVLAEHATGEIVAPEACTPESIVIDRIDRQRLIRTAMVRLVGVTVTVDRKVAHPI